ncbi:MAG: glycosyltransferase family 9 protein, partial [Verrucomicrobia bacterium]|nr:glycosyltransferase family 9 protein [Verrucomicrobiota bacterium]
MGFGTYKIRKALTRSFLRRSGPIARLLLYPTSLGRPVWNRPTLDLARDIGLGDVLMCTPVLRELKRRHPQCHVRFYTEYGPLVDGLPYIDQVLPYKETPPGALYLAYEDAVPPEVHLSRILGDKLGLNVIDTRPDCVVRDDLADGYRQLFAPLPRPRVVFLRRAGFWTPNKNWPDPNWVELITSLARNATVIEIGQKNEGAGAIISPNYVDMRGKTSLEELAALISVADLYVGPVSGPMHIAVAAGTPSVTICGGYESPRGLKHSPGVKSTTNVFLSSDLPCAPCWLREPCPIGLKCLTAISPAQVGNAI